MAFPSMSLETVTSSEGDCSAFVALMVTMQEGEDTLDELDRWLRGVEGKATVVVVR